MRSRDACPDFICLKAKETEVNEFFVTRGPDPKRKKKENMVTSLRNQNNRGIIEVLEGKKHNVEAEVAI